MTIVSEYLDYTKKWKKEYGEKTLVLMQVGSFFESYGLVDNDNNIYGSNITDFAEINDMTVSRKNLCVGNAKVVMAGFGLAQLEKYVKKLQDNGYTIVVYTQDTQAKNTTRSLNTIISPGTYFSNDTKELSNNITCIWIHYSGSSIIINEQISVGISNIDIYTGKTSIFEFSKDYLHNPTTYDELERIISIYNPNECIIVSNLDENIIDDIINYISLNSNKIHKIHITDQTDLGKYARNAEKQIYQEEIIQRFYPTKNDVIILENLQKYCIAIQSFIYLLDFIYKHNPNLINNISEPLFENYTDRLILANHSLKQLNILSDSRFTGKYSCVSTLLNNCITSMGKRKFLYNLLNPITDIERLNNSYDITEHLLNTKSCNNNTSPTWEYYRSTLVDIRDIEKLRRKLILKKITPKDFTILHNTLDKILQLYQSCSKDNILVTYLNNIEDIENIEKIKEISENLQTIIERNLDISKSSVIDDISQEKLGNIDTHNVFYINRGLDEKLDIAYKKALECKQQLECIRKYLSDLIMKYEKSTKTTEFVKINETAKMDATLQATKRRVTFLKKALDSIKDTGITEISLKYKSDFSKTEDIFTLNLELLDFTATGGNQSNLIITSSEIRKIESLINTSKNNLISELEIYYYKFIDKFIEYNLDNIISFVINLDILQCKCFIANEYNYCKPIIKQNNKSFIEFKGIRHCLIEHLNTREIYITNDLKLGKEKEKRKKNNITVGGEWVTEAVTESDVSPSGILLYGTNAVGKTCFIKAIGISVIMAQAGLYVPASEFIYYPYNTIFTRILGNDNIFKGLSTFAVEMSELRTILQLADKNSLILGDELCSGTESDSALSIFVAGLEILHEKNCTFLFATHFHEIIKYDEILALKLLKLYHMSVIFDKTNNKLIYDRKLKEGAGESMYGLEVCKSLNLPTDFLDRAHELRVKYNDIYKNVLGRDVSRYNSKKLKDICELCKINNGSEIHHLEYQKTAKSNNYIINIDANFHKNHVANLINICETCHQNIHKNNKKMIIKKTNNGYEITKS